MFTNTNWRGYRYAAWTGLVLIAAIMVWEATQAQWRYVATMAGFGTLALVFLVMTDHIPSLIDLVVVMAVLVNGAGYVFDLYERFPWFDSVLHGFTLFALTLPLGFLAFFNVLESLGNNRLQLVLAIASFGVALGAWWEVAEWIFDIVMPGDVIKGKNDTMRDIVVDTAGALLAGWLSTVITKDRVAGTWRQG